MMSQRRLGQKWLFGFLLAAILAVSLLAAFVVWAAPASGGSFHDDLAAFDAARWHKADWGNPLPPFWNQWRPDHIQFSDGKMRIRLDTTPCPGGCAGRPYASGEYRSNDYYGYGRFEARLKASNAPGTVTTFFVYTGPYDNNPHDEIDVEILGRDPTRMQVNYFTNSVGHHEVMIDLGFDASQAFHIYAIEWFPDAIRWYVDGVLRHTETGAQGPLPTTPGRIMASLWACTGLSGWCGDFSYPGVPIDAFYDWISYTPLSWRVHLPLVYRSEASPAPPSWLIEDFESIADEWHAE